MHRSKERSGNEAADLAGYPEGFVKPDPLYDLSSTLFTLLH